MNTRRMNIHLHVERLILDGVDLPSHQHPVFQAAIEAEMVRLLEEGSLHSFSHNQTVSEISGGTIQMAHQSHPASLGQQIAQVVVGGIGQ